MRRSIVMVVLFAPLALAAPARAAQVGLDASPNPASVGQRVVHHVSVGVAGRLDVWVSAQGFGQPGLGTLPAGSWSWQCCPSQTAGTAAWHYRSSTTVATGTYRFGADARRSGTYLSTAAVGIASASIWIRIL